MNQNRPMPGGLAGLHNQDRILAYKFKAPERYGVGTAFSDHLDIDEKAMSVKFPFASGKRRDGVGDLLEVTGIRTERHRQNPVILFDHGKTIALPIGLAEDPTSKEYTVFIDAVDQTAWCKAFFYQDSKNSEHKLLCEQLFDLVVKKFLRAGSIGYQVIQARPMQPDYERGLPQGLHLQQVLLLECSIVVMPCNMDTVMKVLAMPEVCGKRLSPYLVKSLTPYAPAKKAQLGYEGKAGPPVESRLQRDREHAYARWRRAGQLGAASDEQMSRLSGEVADANRRQAESLHARPEHLDQQAGYEGKASGLGSNDPNRVRRGRLIGPGGDDNTSTYFDPNQENYDSDGSLIPGTYRTEVEVQQAEAEGLRRRGGETFREDEKSIKSIRMKYRQKGRRVEWSESPSTAPGQTYVYHTVRDDKLGYVGGEDRWISNENPNEQIRRTTDGVAVDDHLAISEQDNKAIRREKELRQNDIPTQDETVNSPPFVAPVKVPGSRRSTGATNKPHLAGVATGGYTLNDLGTPPASRIGAPRQNEPDAAAGGVPRDHTQAMPTQRAVVPQDAGKRRRGGEHHIFGPNTKIPYGATQRQPRISEQNEAPGQEKSIKALRLKYRSKSTLRRDEHGRDQFHQTAAERGAELDRHKRDWDQVNHGTALRDHSQQATDEREINTTRVPGRQSQPASHHTNPWVRAHYWGSEADDTGEDLPETDEKSAPPSNLTRHNEPGLRIDADENQPREPAGGGHGGISSNTTRRASYLGGRVQGRPQPAANPDPYGNPRAHARLKAPKQTTASDEKAMNREGRIVQALQDEGRRIRQNRRAVGFGPVGEGPKADADRNKTRTEADRRYRREGVGVTEAWDSQWAQMRDAERSDEEDRGPEEKSVDPKPNEGQNATRSRGPSELADRAGQTNNKPYAVRPGQQPGGGRRQTITGGGTVKNPITTEIVVPGNPPKNKAVKPSDDPDPTRERTTRRSRNLFGSGQTQHNEYSSGDSGDSQVLTITPDDNPNHMLMRDIYNDYPDGTTNRERVKSIRLKYRQKAKTSWQHSFDIPNSNMSVHRIHTDHDDGLQEIENTTAATDNPNRLINRSRFAINAAGEFVPQSDEDDKGLKSKPFVSINPRHTTATGHPIPEAEQTESFNIYSPQRHEATNSRSAGRPPRPSEGMGADYNDEGGAGRGRRFAHESIHDTDPPRRVIDHTAGEHHQEEIVDDEKALVRRSQHGNNMTLEHHVTDNDDGSTDHLQIYTRTDNPNHTIRRVRTRVHPHPQGEEDLETYDEMDNKALPEEPVGPRTEEEIAKNHNERIEEDMKKDPHRGRSIRAIEGRIQANAVMRERIAQQSGQKDLKSIRMKHRPQKSVYRRLKRSAPGSATIRVKSEDLQKALEAGGALGLKCEHCGNCGSGLEKMKLAGNFREIDLVVKQYGR